MKSLRKSLTDLRTRYLSEKSHSKHSKRRATTSTNESHTFHQDASTASLLTEPPPVPHAKDTPPPTLPSLNFATTFIFTDPTDPNLNTTIPNPTTTADTFPNDNNNNADHRSRMRTSWRESALYSTKLPSASRPLRHSLSQDNFSHPTSSLSSPYLGRLNPLRADSGEVVRQETIAEEEVWDGEEDVTALPVVKRGLRGWFRWGRKGGRGGMEAGFGGEGKEMGGKGVGEAVTTEEARGGSERGLEVRGRGRSPVLEGEKEEVREGVGKQGRGKWFKRKGKKQDEDEKELMSTENQDGESVWEDLD